jgi:hypothetical protein
MTYQAHAELSRPVRHYGRTDLQSFMVKSDLIYHIPYFFSYQECLCLTLLPGARSESMVSCNRSRESLSYE